MKAASTQKEGQIGIKTGGKKKVKSEYASSWPPSEWKTLNTEEK